MQGTGVRIFLFHGGRFMIRLIKYISKEFFGPFLVGLFGFVVFVSIELLYQLSEIIVRNHVGISKLFIIIFYNMPYFISMGIPVGILFAIFWLISRLSNDNELIAFQTLGIPSKKLMVPFFLISILLCLITFKFSDTIVPNANYKAKEALSKYVYKRAETLIEENQFVDAGDGKYLYVKNVDKETGELNEVLLYDVSYDNVKVFHAQRAYKDGGKWIMENGRVYAVKDNGFMDLDFSFKKLDLDINTDVEEFLKFSKQTNEMTTKEIKERIDNFSKLGVNISGLYVAYNEKFSNSFAPFVITLLGVALSLFMNIKSKSWSVITTFLLVVLYQGSGAWLSALGKESIINPKLAPWIPNIIFGAAGIFLFIILDTKLAFKISEFFKKFFFLAVILFISTAGFSEKVNITGESFYFGDNEITFDSSMIINYKDSVIEAGSGKVFLDDDSNVKYSELYGGVKYTYDKSTIEASEMTINFEKNDSLFINTYTVQKYKNKDKKEIEVKVWAETIEKPLKENYLITKNTKLTTCKECVTYYFKARKVSVYPEKFILARDVTMELFGFPVFYFPFYFQSLSSEDNSPFQFNLNFTDNKVTVDISLNYKFDNGTVLNYNHQVINDISTNLYSQVSTFKYGLPFLSSYLYLTSKINNNTSEYIKLDYNFTKTGSVKNGSAYFNYTPSTKISELGLSVDEWYSPYGKLSNIKSFANWKENLINDMLFLNVSSDAFQRKYKKSIISLSKLNINIDGVKPSNLPINKSIIEIWKDRKTTIEAIGKYNFYSSKSNMSGTFNYKSIADATETTYNGVVSENNFLYKDSVQNYDILFFESNLGYKLDSSLKYKKDFYTGGSYVNGASLFNFNFAPTMSFSSDYLNYDNALVFKKVFENTYNTTDRNSVNYEDVILLKIDLAKRLTSKLKLSRSYNLTEGLFDKINSYTFETSSDLKAFLLNYRLITKTTFDVSDSSNIKPQKTEAEVTLKNSYINNISKLIYEHEKDKKIDHIENKTIFSLNRNRVELNYSYYFTDSGKIEDIIPEIITKYTLYSFGNKLIGELGIKEKYTLFNSKLRFLEKNSLFSMEIESVYNKNTSYLTNSGKLKSYDGSEYLYADFTYSFDDANLKFSKFELQKKLICWTLNFSAELNLLPSFELKKFSLTFFINDLKEKNIELNDSGFKFNLM